MATWGVDCAVRRVAQYEFRVDEPSGHTTHYALEFGPIPLVYVWHDRRQDKRVAVASDGVLPADWGQCTRDRPV